MIAKSSPDHVPDASPDRESASGEGGKNALSLDFTRRPVAEILAQAAAKEAADMPEILDYQKWDAWYEGFVKEIASLPGI